VLQTNYEGGIVAHILGMAEKWALIEVFLGAFS
jgi:hypothetical protein